MFNFKSFDVMNVHFHVHFVHVNALDLLNYESFLHKGFNPSSVTLRVLTGLVSFYEVRIHASPYQPNILPLFFLILPCIARFFAT